MSILLRATAAALAMSGASAYQMSMNANGGSAGRVVKPQATEGHASRRSFAAGVFALPFFGAMAGAADAADGALAGEYLDPNHPRGFRTVTVSGNKATIVGKDEPDRPTWKLNGEIDGNGVLIDFRPKGGPPNLLGKFDGEGVTFPDGNRWPKTAAIVGEYSDPNHPDGFRVVTALKDQALIVGADGPKDAQWKLAGKMSGDNVLIDFSPKGGPKDLLGKFDGSGIVFPDGNRWPKVN
eukprot:CAMPEP_0182535684 /NCGR_PEP_ID=MMETSP1323-20130603/18510_1 /TAXON_ID=236787 /ORGANISM="Florenciella parvula, Strain RCC1693" /LENGTH=237 /DNA_ID=CAMNT_0024745849 /DNA_START=35 /DNA_END=748 /DNA_ORIENTATION=+